MPGGHAKELIVARNTRHQTIGRLEHALGHVGLIDNLSRSAVQKQRLPAARYLNEIAAQLEDTEPVELLIAYARDAGVLHLPGHLGDVFRLTARLGRLNREERTTLLQVLAVLAEQFARGRRQRRRNRS